MNRTPVVKDGVRVREEAFGALLFTNRTPILSLNKNSYAIWKEITGNKTVGEICSLIRKQLGTVEDPSKAICLFLSACEDLDLIAFR